MAALTSDRDTPRKYLERALDPVPVAASTVIYAGSQVAINAAGYAVPAADTAGLRVLGRAEQTVDNSAGANGDESVPVTKGVFRYDNAAGADAIVDADIGASAYVYDDQTVGKNTATIANAIVSGTVDSIDAGGVWVAIL